MGNQNIIQILLLKSFTLQEVDSRSTRETRGQDDQEPARTNLEPARSNLETGRSNLEPMPMEGTSGQGNLF